jgi:hypothetical protein
MSMQTAYPDEAGAYLADQLTQRSKGDAEKMVSLANLIDAQGFHGMHVCTKGIWGIVRVSCSHGLFEVTA